MTSHLWALVFVLWIGLPVLFVHRTWLDALDPHRMRRIDTALEAALEAALGAGRAGARDLRTWLREGQGLALHTRDTRA